MKYLCLAFGDEDGWNSLNEAEQQDALDHDAVIRDRGNLMSAVHTAVTSVRNWNDNLQITDGPHVQQTLPLAGFAVIEADSVDQVIEMVHNTPCARARGVIEIRRFWEAVDLVGGDTIT